jgi:RHS repeat-associated protein
MRDTNSGLQLMGQRVYTSDGGRFLQTDPAGPGGSDSDGHAVTSTYGYTAGDPVNQSDLQGLWPHKILLNIGVNCGIISCKIYLNRHRTDQARSWGAVGTVVGLICLAVLPFVANPILAALAGVVCIIGTYFAYTILQGARNAYPRGGCAKYKVSPRPWSQIPVRLSYEYQKKGDWNC